MISMSMENVSENECNMTVKLEELFCNFTPDAAIIMIMLIMFMNLLVKKGVMTNDEVNDISLKAGELMVELQQKFS